MASSLSLHSTLPLNSGTHIPRLGFGVWKSPVNLCARSCLSALALGYRHIDTAQGYGNEAEVGQAIRQSGLKREELFITSKIFEPGNDDGSTYDKILESVRKVDGQQGYLDLMLVHTPSPGPEGIKRMWQAMEKLHFEGRLKTIGVSNFGIGDIDRMKEYAKVWPPAVNQLELHPWLQQRQIVSYCRANDIVIEAYCPLLRNRKVDDPTLTAIAKKHGKSTTQILVRYSLEKGWVPLPKSDKAERIASNADVYDFTLHRADMEILDGQGAKNEKAVVMAVSNE